MKKVMCIIMVMVITISLSACNIGEKKCKKCEQIVEMQAKIEELNAYVHANRNMEGSREFDSKEEELEQLRNQLSILLQHDCPIPSKNVENMEYRIGDYIGTYTGEWKSNAPHGKGTFKGKTDNEKCEIYYSGDWVNGNFEGYGEYAVYDYFNNNERAYKGEFKNNYFHGTGSFYENIHMNVDDCMIWVEGEFENGKLVYGTFTEADQNGKTTDYGTMEGPNWTKTSSAKAEAEERYKQELKQKTGEAIGQILGRLF